MDGMEWMPPRTGSCWYGGLRRIGLIVCGGDGEDLNSYGLRDERPCAFNGIGRAERESARKPTPSQPLRSSETCCVRISTQLTTPQPCFKRVKSPR